MISVRMRRFLLILKASLPICVGDHMCLPQKNWGRILNCSALPGLIGAEMREIRCCSGFTEPIIPKSPCWRNICIALRKPKNGTIANWVRNLIYILFKNRLGTDSSSGILKARGYASLSKDFMWMSITSTDTSL